MIRRERFLRCMSRARVRRGVALMGVCNVTPDSFSDGGRFFAADDAKAHVDRLLAHGADIIDVGGESTRPGAASVPDREQLARVLDVVRYAAGRACVSIDTTSPVVAAACLDAGAAVVNDVSCLRDPELARVAAANGAALVVSHARVPQESMRGFGGYPEGAYRDVLAEVTRELLAAARTAEQAGVDAEAIVLDPGLGFSKSSRHSMTLLRRTAELVERVAPYPVLVGASRKSFLTLVDEGAPASERVGLSIAAATHAARSGAAVVRVHDVRETRQAIDLGVVLTTHGHGDRREQG